MQVLSTYRATVEAGFYAATDDQRRYLVRYGEQLLVLDQPGPEAGVLVIEPEDAPYVRLWIERERLEAYAEFRCKGEGGFWGSVEKVVKRGAA